MISKAQVTVQPYLAHICTGDTEFSIDLNLGDGQSGNKFPHSKFQGYLRSDRRQTVGILWSARDLSQLWPG
ncbi:MAG: hypothetical protein ABI557_15850, partial [Aureliella sp.]